MLKQLSQSKDLLLLKTNYDWEKITTEFDWIRAMKNCPQDKIYHAEGDVWIHTRMVVEELFKLSGWQKADNKTQSLLFAACLLHDVAKPICTVIEQTGSITSKGHAKKGEKMSRQILAEYNLPFNLEEQICKLVRYHGLPLWFLEKPDSQKAVIQASLAVNTSLLSLVAEADVRGRYCKDKEDLLYKVELFREFCKENNCYAQAKSFASNHTRFLYFRKEGVYPETEIYDDTELEVFLMVGIPGSGKDTWIRQNKPNLPVVSLDNIRQEMDISFTDNQGKIIQEAQERAKQWMRKKQSFVWNATNITKDMRKKLIDLFAVYKAKITLVYIHCSLEKALKQNIKREIQIKEKVIYDYFRRLEPPNLSEAHQVWVVEAPAPGS